VKYAAEPADLVKIDETGMVTPLANGTVKITATSPEGVVGSAQIEVAHVGNELPINFSNEIVPIFSKLGCNSGGCHGKASGQNGAAGFRADRRLRVPGERGPRPAAVPRRPRSQPAVAQGQ
jgi:hypothetical protein